MLVSDIAVSTFEFKFVHYVLLIKIIYIMMPNHSEIRLFVNRGVQTAKGGRKDK